MTEQVTEQVMAGEAADALEQLARDLRAGRVALRKYEMDVEMADGLPTGRVTCVVGVMAGETPRREGPMSAKVDGITLGPVVGLGVKPLGGERVELEVRCLGTYDGAETLMRLAGERARRVKGRMTAGDINPERGPGG